MNIVEVKNVFDIPNIDKYMDKYFSFENIDFGDRLRCYSYELYTEMSTIDLVIINNEGYIFRKELLSDLATSTGLEFFSLTLNGVNYTYNANKS